MKIFRENKLIWITLIIVLIVACNPDGGDEKLGLENSSFSYPVRVQTVEGEEISNANVTIEVAKMAPLNEITDSTGFTRIFIDSSYIKQPGKLIVKANGYERYVQNIDLIDGTLPDVIQLKSLSPTATLTPSTTNTPEVTATDTPTVTFTPSPSPTNTPEITVTNTPTPVPKMSKYQQISLESVVNESTFNGYAIPPVGEVELEGVIFNLPSGQNSVTTQAEPLPEFPTTLNFSADIFAPEAVYLLITGGNVFSHFDGEKIGEIRLTFQGNDPITIDLIAGQNIREWKILDEVTVSTAKSKMVSEVWRTDSNFGGVGIIDMLTIELPPQYHSDSLKTIEIIDTSVETVGSKDPAINVIGITVEGQ